MGFIQHSGTNGGEPIKNRTIVTVSEGDTAIFEIDFDNTKWEDLAEKDDENGFEGTEVNLDDLVNEANSWRERASDLRACTARRGIWI